MATWHASINGVLVDPLWACLIGLGGGAILGAVITWLFGRASSKELRAEATGLREELGNVKRQSLLAPRMLELQGQGAKVTLNRDGSGDVTGLNVHGEVRESLTLSVSVHDVVITTVTPQDDPPKS